MSAIKFDRTPYKVTYLEDGVKKTIRRVPPPKLHESLPEDVVTLNVKKNDDWEAGESYVVKNMNPRQPNVLQLVNESGEATFVSALDTTLTEKRALRPGQDIRDLPANNRYLLWP